MTYSVEMIKIQFPLMSPSFLNMATHLKIPITFTIHKPLDLYRAKMRYTKNRASDSSSDMTIKIIDIIM